MSDIGICRFCKHMDKDIVQKPCLHCSANTGAFELDLAEHDKQIIENTFKVLNQALKDLGQDTIPRFILDGVAEQIKGG